ncbi:MAG TPA: oligoribonuclease [Polyangiaceae bacterium]|nr:oligoribonuclease [Polyangiaceae bacterium]
MPTPSETPPQRQQSPTNLVWLDLEMTGLDAQVDAILQAAVIITNAELTPLEQFSCDIWQPESTLDRMTPFVRDMHEKTGLLERVRKSKIELRRAEQHLLEIVSGWCPYGAVLCGNSIWQDRRFIDQHMPGFAGYLTYRLVDVSSIKLLAKTWYGPTSVYTKPPEGEHDALVDIKNSIAELAHYRKTLFRG